MKIVGLLSWYEESPHWLSTAVAGFGRFCDVIVAVDGAYALYPAARRCSHPNEAEAVMYAAEAAGCASMIYRPQEVFFGNEIEKRQLAIDLCAPLLQEGEDWLCVFDADYHPMIVDPDTIRYQLRQTDLDVATYTIFDGRDFMAQAATERMAKKLDIDQTWTVRTRDLYRWNPTLKIGPMHWSYSVAGEGGEPRWLRGPECVPLADACHLESALVVYHRTADRAKQRREAAERYYQAREEMGLEPPPDAQPVEAQAGIERRG